MVDLVVRAVSTNLAQFVGQTLGPIPGLTLIQLQNAIKTAIESYVTINTPGTDIPLSGVAVDYESNKAEIESILTANHVWHDTVTAATGQIIIEMIATALTYMQYNIVRSTQETLFDTLRIDSSALAATRFLGVRIARRIPSQCSVTLVRTGDASNSLEIAPYQQFSASSNGNGLSLFNRTTLIFPASVTTINTQLYEGQVGNLVQFVSTGKPYQSFILGQGNFAISDVDVTCTVGDIPWNRAAYGEYFNVGLWEYKSTDLIFSDDSTADGNVEVQFGNGIFGRIPDTGSRINLTYVLTNGQEGNVSLVGNTVAANFANNIFGTITTANKGGTNALAPMEYKTLSPGLFAAKYRATTRQDHAAIARRYPGVIDAIFEGQAELAPADLRQMLISRCTLLTNTVWETTDFDAFKVWFENFDMANMRLYFNAPTAVPMNITATIYCKDSASLNSLQNRVNANLQAAFVLRSGILGYKRAISDIGDIIKRTDRALIDYYDITVPSADVTVNRDQYVTLGTVILNMAYTSRVGL